MKSTGLIKALALCVVIFALIAAGVGLFWESGGEPFVVQTIRGESVKLYGDGLYKYDTYFKAPINKGTDAVTLFIAIPLLLLAIAYISKNEIKGMLFTTSILSYFLYYSTCVAFGVSYNILFPIYLLLFSASLFAFLIGFIRLCNVNFTSMTSPKMPNRGIAIFLILSGLSTFVWMVEIIGAAVSGNPPSTLAIYTSEISFVLDPGVIAPAAFASAIMIWRRKSIGYIGGAILLTLNAIVGIMVISQTIVQSLAGIVISTGQLIAYVGIFMVMGSFAIGLNIRLFKNIKA